MTNLNAIYYVKRTPHIVGFRNSRMKNRAKYIHLGAILARLAVARVVQRGYTLT